MKPLRHIPVRLGRVILPVLALVLPGAAAAEVWPRETTPATVPVYEIGRPDFDPPGIFLGDFLIRPSATETAAYDGNIFASHRKVVGDFVNTTREELAFDSQWSRHRLGGRLYTAQQVYAGHPGEDADTFGAEASGRLDVTRDLFFDLEGGFVQQPQQRAAPEATVNRTGRPIYDTGNGTLGFVQRLNRLVERAQVSVVRIDYVTAGNTARDSVTTTVRDRVSYDLSERISLFLQVSYALRDWDVRADERNFDTLTGLAGVTVSIPTVVEADIGVGALRQTYANAAFAPLVAPAVNGHVTWNMLPLTTILADVSSTVTGTETFCGARAGTCQTDGGPPLAPGTGQRNTLETTEAQIAAQHEIWHDLLGEVRLRYQHDAFGFNDLVHDTYSANANLRFLINRHLEADFDYTFRKRDANQPDNTTFNSGAFTEHIIGISLRVGL
jgi:hypothetical protein